jgi:hypothetical protein
MYMLCVENNKKRYWIGADGALSDSDSEPEESEEEESEDEEEESWELENREGREKE